MMMQLRILAETTGWEDCEGVGKFPTYSER